MALVIFDTPAGSIPFTGSFRTLSLILRNLIFKDAAAMFGTVITAFSALRAENLPPNRLRDRIGKSTSEAARRGGIRIHIQG